MYKTERLNYLKFRILNMIKYDNYSKICRQDILYLAKNILGSFNIAECDQALKDLVESKLLKKNRVGRQNFYSTSKNIGPRSVDINDETFGVELEFASKIPNKEFISILFEMGLDINQTGGAWISPGSKDYSRWTVSTDCSIEVDDYDYDVEIISPVLKGYQGLKELKMVMDMLKRLKQFGIVKFNKTCGTHVHHSSKNIKSMKRFIDILVESQPMMNEMVSNWRAVTDEQIEDSLNSGKDEEFCFSPIKKEKYYEDGRIDWYGDKFLNVSIRNHKRNKTIEFRQFQATFNFRKLYEWIIMGQKLIESENFKGSAEV